MMRMHYPSPQWLAKVDGLHPHLAQQMADARNFTKGDGFHPRRRILRAGAGPPERLDTSGIAIDQVSKYKYLGVVYQEDGSWQAHAQRRSQRCKQPMGTGGLLSCSSLDRQVRLLMVQTFIYSAVMYGAEGGTKAVKDKMSAVVKALRSILALHPETASDVLWGHWATHPVYSLMLPNCVGSTDPEHGG
jgi:gluconate kinase